MSLVVVGIGILVLFLLVAVIRLNTFISFILVALGIGIFQGMPLDQLVKSLEKGIGNILGF